MQRIPRPLQTGAVIQHFKVWVESFLVQRRRDDTKVMFLAAHPFCLCRSLKALLNFVGDKYKCFHGLAILPAHKTLLHHTVVFGPPLMIV